MQTLDFKDMQDLLEHREYDIPQGATGMNFKVIDGKESVILSVDGKEITLTVKGARDLALALRQSSNRIERQTFDRLGKGAKKHLR